jgi:HAD superfamily hydrolase (TIGR01509 family)
MIKAILFDIDGVLLDSKAANTLWYQNILEAYGYGRPSEKEVHKVISLTVKDALKRLTKEKSKEKMKKVIKAGPQFNYPYAMLKADKDIEKVIGELSKKYLLGIVTHRRRSDIKDVFRISRIKKYFRVFISVEDFSRPKPAPDPLLVAASKLKVKPAECIYVGDSLVDVKASRAARMRFIGYSRKRMRGANATVDSFKSLIPAITKLD